MTAIEVMKSGQPFCGFGEAAADTLQSLRGGTEGKLDHFAFNMAFAPNHPGRDNANPLVQVSTDFTVRVLFPCCGSSSN